MDLDSDDENVSDEDFYSFLNVPKDVGTLRHLWGMLSMQFCRFLGFKRGNQQCLQETQSDVPS